ncbi:MAG TPA: hypothetical protein VGY54_21435 [Polyangiaceae bacterium]|nr:hypothetical protein [Polyangiaceae bacterium]
MRAIWVALGILEVTACGGATSLPTGNEGASETFAQRAPCTTTAGDHPTDLACTGLYADGALGTVAADVLAFAPGESLRADGATKRRFIRLPPGTAIDSRDMDEWVFPTGTKFWKEFSVGGHKVETRYLEKRADSTWIRTTYAWSDDESHASEVTTGVLNARGTGHDIPTQIECSECHAGAIDGVLGFEAVGLSAPTASGMTLQELARRGLLTHPPVAAPVIPGTPLDVAALGWLHANCGNACHNGTENALAHRTGLRMRLTVDALGSVAETDTWKTAVGVPSGFQPTPGAGLQRIKPGDAAHSAIPFRDGSRVRTGAQPGWQMPPIATNLPDVADVDMVKAWIDSLGSERAVVATHEETRLFGEPQ